MRSKIILTAFILVIAMFATVSAQQSLFSGCSSAGVNNQTVLFNCDFFDPIGLPGVEVNLHYRPQMDSEFTSQTMQLMDEIPFYMMTYETGVNYITDPFSVEYYFSGGTDSIIATQSPKNTDDLFPPSRDNYAPFSLDPLDDTTNGSAGGWLDLKGSGMTYSDSKVYGYLENATGTWPSNQGLTPFLYALGFVPLTGSDSVMYAMVYINIPFVLTPGVYKMSIADTSLERLGDIDYMIYDGLLHLACDITTFENDPDWPGWPPPNGFLVSVGMTMSFESLTPNINDITYPTFYEPKTQFLDFTSNNIPELLNYRFDTIPGVSLTARVDYLDADNNLPTARNMYFNYGEYTMASFDHIYIDTSEFQKTIPWPGEGWHYYYFRFSDGSDTVSTPFDSIYLSLSGIEENQSLPRMFALEQNYPNPFNSSTVISFTLSYRENISVDIYDISGRLVRNLLTGILTPGEHSLIWDGRDDHDLPLSSGTYFYNLKTGSDNITRKMVYLK